jgi:hypothetical protein
LRDNQGKADQNQGWINAARKRLQACQRKVPSDAKYYGVTFGEHRNPSAEEVEHAAQTVVMTWFTGSNKLY